MSNAPKPDAPMNTEGRGWLARQATRAAEDIKTLPDWLRKPREDAPMKEEPTDVAQKVRARIENLVNRGAEICPLFVSSEGNVSCEKCGYSSDIHLLRDVRAALAQREKAPPREICVLVDEMLRLYAARFTDENSRQMAVQTWAKQFANAVASQVAQLQTKLDNAWASYQHEVAQLQAENESLKEQNGKLGEQCSTSWARAEHAEASASALREAVQAFLDVWLEAERHIDNACAFLFAHGGRYTGPSLAEPLEKLRAALRPAQD